MTPTHALFDVSPIAITICKKGANGQRIFLKKSQDDDELLTLPAEHSILKSGDDWSVFYCVVAAPGAEEDCGIGDDAGTGIVDVWKSEEEIAAAAHRLLKNKGYVNAMHDALAAEGCAIVENAVALTDLWVGEQVIKKGSWYVGIEPSPEFRAQVDAGEITGVSLEGTGYRELIAKSAPDFSARAKQAKRLKSEGHDHATIARKMGITVDAVKQHLAKADKSPDAKIPNKPGKTNWLEQRGGFPRFMRKVIEDLLGSHPEWLATQEGVSHAIRLGVGIVQNWAEGHDGKGNKVSAKTQAKAAAAVAEWERKKSGGSVKKADADEVAREGVRLLKQMAEESLLLKIARKLGMADSELPVELLKADQYPQTFAGIMAGRQLTDELPAAFDALREAIWCAFYPRAVDSEGDVGDARDLIAQSLDEFRTWAIDFMDQLGISGKGDGAASVKKAALSAGQRKKLPKTAFVFPDKAPGPGSYPIHDRRHGANALTRAAGKPEESTVRAAVCKRHPDLPACQKPKVKKSGEPVGGYGCGDCETCESCLSFAAETELRKALGIDTYRLPWESVTLEDEVDQETANKILKAQEDTTSALNKLVDAITEGKLVSKPQKKEDAPEGGAASVQKTDPDENGDESTPLTKADLRKALDELLVEMATGASAQPDGDDDVDADGKKVKKTSDPLKGLLV